MYVRSFTGPVDTPEKGNQTEPRSAPACFRLFRTSLGTLTKTPNEGLVPAENLKIVSPGVMYGVVRRCGPAGTASEVARNQAPPSPALAGGKCRHTPAPARPRGCPMARMQWAVFREGVRPGYTGQRGALAQQKNRNPRYFIQSNGGSTIESYNSSIGPGRGGMLKSKLLGSCPRMRANSFVSLSMKKAATDRRCALKHGEVSGSKSLMCLAR